MATGKKMGRPPGGTLYPNKEDIKDQIVNWISDGKTLQDFCRQEGMPAFRTIYNWQAADKDFDADIARAREIGHDSIAEEALRIADNIQIGRKVVTHSGGDEDDDAMTVTEEDMLGHRKLQIDTRMRLLRAWHPKKYGDKTIMAGDDTNPVVIEASFDIFGELLKNIAMKRQAGE